MPMLANEIKTKAYKTLEEMLEDRPDYIIEAASLVQLRRWLLKSWQRNQPQSCL